MRFVFKELYLLFLLLLFVAALNAQQTLFIDKQEYSCASNFNIAVRTQNISNVAALQGTITWDTAVVKYNNISFGSSAITLNSSNVNVSAAANGYLTFLWVDNNLQGQSTPDNTSLFTINFVTNGTGKGKVMIAFGNTPTSLEIDTLDNNSLPAVDADAVFTDGYIVTPFIYNFIGSGNWDVAANWKNSILPPAALPACSEILINPVGNAECILNVPQTISAGAKITVTAGKKLKVAGNLILQ